MRDFRTLYIPQAFLDAANASAVAAHSGRLCCVYTRTTLTNRDRPYLVTYDNNERAVDGASFEQAADSAFNAVCNMGMGREDCEAQAGCVREAIASLDESPSESSASGPRGPTLSCALVALLAAHALWR